MKRLLGISKRKKEKNDADLYEPPAIAHQDSSKSSPSNDNSNGRNSDGHAHSAFSNPQKIGGPQSSTYPGMEELGNVATSSDVGSRHSSNPALSAGYRYALNAYADTINPAVSNEDGMGGGGGTLRSRSGRTRGSAGSKHRSLIPTFEHPSPRDGTSAADWQSTGSSSLINPGDKYIYSDAYEQLMYGRGSNDKQGNFNNENAGSGRSIDVDNKRDNDNWAPIPEEPKLSPGSGSASVTHDEHQNIGDSHINQQLSSQSFSQSSQSHNIGTNQSEGANNETSTLSGNDALQNQPHPQQQLSSVAQQSHGHGIQNPSYIQTTPNTNFRATQRQILIETSQYPDVPTPQSTQSPQFSQHSITSPASQQTHGNSSGNTTKRPSSSASNNTTAVLLQPDAIYEEHYGDAYVDQFIKYLYPAGYQSMRPRSGPWKLSIFIFLLFLWLSVFIVGHCYDRGQREYDDFFGDHDDAYLEELDDDTLVMETRWCGSKLLYFMWMVSVSITMLALSYCSIIGYVKIRDVAVSNGRSQPAGMGEIKEGRSDFYMAVDNVSNCNVAGAAGSSTGIDKDSEITSSSTSGRYSSYQGGSKYIPSIYQSDGTPQFWGGHIYRPTQAAVAMANR